MRQTWISILDAMPPTRQWIYIKRATSDSFSSGEIEKVYIRETDPNSYKAKDVHNVIADLFQGNNISRDWKFNTHNIVGWRHADDEEGGPKQ